MIKDNMKRSYTLMIIEVIVLLLAISFESKTLVAVVSILIHEFTHILVGNKLGCKLYNIKFSLTGANAQLSDLDDLIDKDKVLLYLSGPMSNLIISIIMYILYKLTNIQIFEVVSGINMWLCIFNLIPAYPLDGARILEIIISNKSSYLKGKKITSTISYIVSCILLGLFLTLIFVNKINISILFILLLIIYSTVLEKKWTMYIVMGDIIKKRRRLEKYDFMENKSVSVFYKNGLLDLMRLVDRNKFNTFYILDEELKLISILHEDELLEALKTYGNITLEEYNEMKSSL